MGDRVIQLTGNRGICDINRAPSSEESLSSGPKGPLDFFVRDFRFRPAAAARARASGGTRGKGKKRNEKRPGRPSHLPRICRATDFSAGCITHLLSAGNVVAHRRRMRAAESWCTGCSTRGMRTGVLCACPPHRCVHTHSTHKGTHTNKCIVL